MAYKTSFSLLNTEKLNDITVKSGNYSATFTYPYENVEGTIPSSECESDVDMNYSLEFTENNPYDDESLATYMYKFSFRNLPNGGGGINASTWSFEGIQLLSTGYLPLTLTDSNLNDLMFVHPSIQIPNITINGNDYWDSHKTQYNNLIGTTAGPITLNLRGYPISNTVTIEDPSEEYYYTDNNDNDIRDYSLTKNTNLTIKINKMPEFWEVPREITAQGVYQIPSSNFSVTMPNSVTEIGMYGLTSCFSNCDKLTSFDANNITSIGQYGLQYCFYNCTSLTTAPTFDRLTNVGNQGLQQCFYGCTALTTVPTFASLTTIGSNGLDNCFENCTTLKNSLTTPPTFANLTTIGAYGMNKCFYNFKALTTAPTFANLTSIGNYGLQQCFYGCTSITTAPTFANLTTIGGSGLQYCFYGCTSLTTPPTFASLTTIGGSYSMSYCFDGCTSLITAPTFDNLTSISGEGLYYCFYNCTSLTTPPTFSNLTTVDVYGFWNCFYNCTSLTGSITFTNLTKISLNGFEGCFRNTKITSLSFPKLNSSSFYPFTNCFNNMLSGVTGCTVHFPSNLQSVIGSWSDVSNGFGGTNTTVLFDLPATS